MHLTRLSIAGALVAAALALAACGSSSSDDDGASTSSSAPSSQSDGSGGAATIAVKNLDGVGEVLVDAQGMALYTPEQEADGTIKCTGSCVSFWIPLEASGKPSASGDAGKLGTIRRPDGTLQVTANGKPLYTFSQDSAGSVTGDGFSDDFGGTHFTWHAVAAGGSPSGSSTSASGSGGGNSGSSGGSTSDGYDYDSNGY